MFEVPPNPHEQRGETAPLLIAADWGMRRPVIPEQQVAGSNPARRTICSFLSIANVNFATALKQTSLATTREKLVNYREPRNPHPSLGTGGRDDVPVAGREAVKLKVKRTVRSVWFCLEDGAGF